MVLRKKVENKDGWRLFYIVWMGIEISGEVEGEGEGVMFLLVVF